MTSLPPSHSAIEIIEQEITDSSRPRFNPAPPQNDGHQSSYQTRLQKRLPSLRGAGDQLAVARCDSLSSDGDISVVRRQLDRLVLSLLQLCFFTDPAPSYQLLSSLGSSISVSTVG